MAMSIGPDVTRWAKQMARDVFMKCKFSAYECRGNCAQRRGLVSVRAASEAGAGPAPAISPRLALVGLIAALDVLVVGGWSFSRGRPR